MASFIPPKIQDNPNGWGPNDPPEQYKDLPYAPFSKGDRLGKVMCDRPFLLLFGDTWRWEDGTLQN